MTAQFRLFSILLTQFVLAVFLAAPLSASIKIQVGDDTEEVQSYKREGVEYVSLVGLSRALNEGTVDWDIPGQQVSYVVGRHRFEFLVGSPFAKLDDASHNLIYATIYRKGDLYIPAETFLPILNQVSNSQLAYDSKSSSVRAQERKHRVKDIQFSEKANGLLIEVMVSDPVSYDLFVTEGNWINISIRGGQIDIAKIESRLDPKLMHQIKAIQEQGVAQISVQLKKNVSTKPHHKLVHDPTRIQIAVPVEGFSFDSVSSATTYEPQQTFDGTIDVIVVDAGHGGKDYGAIGPDRTREKDVALQIARRLADKLREDGRFKVIMTRNSDVYITLPDRARIANENGADLFISIHANASPSRRARGWNVFFLAPAKNDSARAVEQLENSYFVREMQMEEDTSEADTDTNLGGAGNPIMGILNDMLMTEFQAESHDLAMMIDAEFRNRLETPARGVDQAGFFVLNKVFTPSVLVESAFISNRTEVKLLKSAAYQEKVATGVYEAVKQFADKYNTPPPSQ